MVCCIRDLVGGNIFGNKIYRQTINLVDFSLLTLVMEHWSYDDIGTLVNAIEIHHCYKIKFFANQAL